MAPSKEYWTKLSRRLTALDDVATEETGSTKLHHQQQQCQELANEARSGVGVLGCTPAVAAGLLADARIGAGRVINRRCFGQC